MQYREGRSTFLWPILEIAGLASPVEVEDEVKVKWA
jgi:hypothetical protein